MLIVLPKLGREISGEGGGYSCGPDLACCRFDSATDRSAASSSGGRDFPRFAARRRIPAQAFWLKKNRSGMRPISKTCDNEDSTTTLGNSEVLCVQHSVGPPIPELAQRPEEGSQDPSSVNRQDTWDVFPNHPTGSKVGNDAKVGEGEVSAWVVKSFAESSDGEGLTGAAADHNVN